VAVVGEETHGAERERRRIGDGRRDRDPDPDVALVVSPGQQRSDDEGDCGGQEMPHHDPAHLPRLELPEVAIDIDPENVDGSRRSSTQDRRCK